MTIHIGLFHKGSPVITAWCTVIVDCRDNILWKESDFRALMQLIIILVYKTKQANSSESFAT